ncbi:hypothetical protein BDF20DRAFT_916150 [Mycotypha africana]|uniref:uncharacterized protein n=1 Tax=Mycotypha africana TaxID=64632 RepID=UPI002301E30E|nr:uncharacterized protein BDF20DRAFT_916150 [Mycotypha africana]KAI8970333.1 hypothetical protein BDF20DRAFT_916150 [Mycotypha africana]
MNSNSTNADLVIDLDITNPDLLEATSELISLTCITCLAVALGAKTYGEKIKSLNYGRMLVIALYTLSWAFATTSVIIVSTNNNNIVSCTLGMLACDFFYAGSKIAIYAWLIERCYLVTAVKTTRLKTPLYKFHLLLLCPYVVIFVLMLCFRNIYLEPDGQCTIGLQDIASMPLLIYDFIFNLYLTWLFVRPLTTVGRNARSDWKVSRVYKLARRTLVASIVCLSVSFVNVLSVYLSHGHQRGLICLTMCTVDVTVNVITVHWVTANKSSGSGNNRTKTNVDEHLTADMTFDIDNKQSKPVKFDAPMVEPYMMDDDSSSTVSAEVSHTSKKPINNYYN